MKGGGAAPGQASNCAFATGCGTRASPAARMPADVAALVANHPCYSEEAHHHFARLHLAVAPGCNVQCHYCNRKFDCANESRPGVVSARLTPEQAVARVQAVAAEVPELSVVGIAGPGDPLANPEATFATLEGVRRAAPDLTLCLSTNGLALPAHVDRLAALGVRHVTVTVNMIDPAVGERIYPWVIWNGRRVTGAEASRILSERQLTGIARLVERGVLVKVNAVVIPGVNELHLPAVARTVRSLGAFMVNLVPLLSAPEHGTHYGLTGQRGPTPAELERVQSACQVDGRLMRHCRQCRADAVGKLSEDRFAEFTVRTTQAGPPPAPARDTEEEGFARRRGEGGTRAMEEEGFARRRGEGGTRAMEEEGFARRRSEGGARAMDIRAEHRRAVEAVRARADAERRAALKRVAAGPEAPPARAAVATRGGGLIDRHFGHAREFLVYDVSREGARLVGVRKAATYCQGGEGEDDALAGTLRALEGCRAVLVAKIGACPAGQLTAAGIIPVTAHAFQPIEAGLLDWYRGQAQARAEALAAGAGLPLRGDWGEEPPQQDGRRSEVA